MLKAGSGWTNFRGNVDALTIAVDGVATTYDFERVAATPVGYRLQTTMTDGVVAPSWNVDTTYAAGAQVTYSFASRPGRADPIIVLDDTLVATSGQITMTRDRKFQVFSDTMYSYETLQPLERAIADLERQLLSSSDKAGAQEASTRFFLNQLASGIDPAVLARATTVAEYVASDPITDSTAIRVTDAALTTFDIFINIYPDPAVPFDVYHVDATDVGPVFQNAPSGATSRLSRQSVRSPIASRRTERLRAIGRLPSGARIASPADGISAPSSRRSALSPTVRSSDISNYAEFPTEQLFVIYSNGIWTEFKPANESVALISHRLSKEERFNNWWTTVIQHHNRTWSVERADLDRGDSCAARAENDATVFSPARVYALYLRCKNPPVRSWLRGLNDLFETLRMRHELLSGKLPSNPDVLRLTTLIATQRNDGNAHVILVGHSEGTLLDAQAIRALPTLESHPVNVANRCVAAMALAPLAPPDQFGLDEHHVKGLLASGDIATTLAGSGWTAFDVPLSKLVVDSSAVPSEPLPIATAPWFAIWGSLIHRVNRSYLSGPGLELFVGEMTALHKECLPKSVTLTLSTSTAALASELTADTKAFNQNDRELPGRIVSIGGPVVQQQQTNRLTARYPKDEPQQVRASVTDFIFADAPLTVPVFNIPLTVSANRRLTWRSFAAANGPGGTFTDHPAPTTPPAGCPEYVRYDNADGSWLMYAAFCETTYTPVYERLTALPGGLSVDDVRITMPTAPGDPGTKRFGDVCIDDVVCIISAKVEFLHQTYDEQGQIKWDVVGRSAEVPVGGG